MVLYEDYFPTESSPSTASSLIYSALSNHTIYDIYFLPSSYVPQNIKQEYLSTLTWLDDRFVSRFDHSYLFWNID